MKKIIITSIDLFLIIAMVLSITSVKTNKKKITITNRQYYVNSKKIKVELEEVPIVNVSTEEQQEDDKVQEQEEIKEEEVIEEESTIEQEEPKEIEVPEQQEVVEQKIEEENKEEVIVPSTLTGKISGYGADIGEYTSYGYSIKDRITYSDDTYGNLRILAAGSEYPYGTVVKITGSSQGEILGIVLDRGPNIGEGKKFLFDILYQTSEEAYRTGVEEIEYQILRMGW